jgi:hypothetical protein
MPDKIIVSNKSALMAKYGVNGVNAIESAVNSLVASDLKRGISTVLVYLDAPSLGANQVTLATDPAQNKKAIDAVYNGFNPQFLMILGSVDVVPHQDLANPCQDNVDLDSMTSSDLPYACAGPYSQDINSFTNPTRVVGRLPNITGDTQPQYLLNLLGIATNFTSRPAADFSSYLGVTASVWTNSTTLSLTNTFGNSGNLKISPPDGPAWAPSLLQSRSHFFNCHGGSNYPDFLGQDGGNYPVAHQASYLAGKLSEGTVASCECCYGAELYNPAGGQTGMANTYLQEKAYAYFGSTTIAYGNETGNGCADLICQFFLQSILKGASAGRAALEARQKFLSVAVPLDIYNAKTIGQYVLLGDPSIQPVQSAPPAGQYFAKSATGGFEQQSALQLEAKGRINRRLKLRNAGIYLGSNTSYVTLERGLKISGAIQEMIQKQSQEAGAVMGEYKSYLVRHPEGSRQAKSNNKDIPFAVHVATGKLRSNHPKVVRIVAYVVTESQSGFSLKTLYSR